LVFYSSAITVMHGPINITFKGFIPLLHVPSCLALSCSFWAIFFIS